MRRWPIRFGMAFLLLTVPHGEASAQDPAVTFRQNCSTCHTIGGGRLTGPDLKDVASRRDRAWLVRFIQNARAVIDSGDPYAAQLVQEARGVVMPTIAGMTPAVAESLIDLIVAESKRPTSQFAGAVLIRPFTANDLLVGRNLFLGTLAQSGRGPACVSCHSVGGLDGLAGGRLGPDLTRAIERLQGTKGLTAWLSAPATPTMQSVYGKAPLQPEEILALVAYLEGTAKAGVPVNPVAQLNFFLMGLGGAVVGLVAFDAAWKGRFRGVRRSLVHGHKPGGHQ